MFFCFFSILWPKSRDLKKKTNLPSEQPTYHLPPLFQFLSRSKYGSERAAFITCQWHVLMKPSFVCLIAPVLHLSFASQCRDSQHSPCQLLFTDREGITFDLTPRVRVCVSFHTLWNPCNITTVKHGLLHSAGWVLCGQEKACHCLRATVPQCGLDRECDICLCCQECGVGVRLCSSTAGAGLSSFSYGNTSWLLLLLYCHSLKAGLTTVNLGFI